MPAPDNGGFDVAIELNRAALAAAVAGSLTIPIGNRSVSTGGIQGQITPAAAVSNVELRDNNDVVAVISINGTTLQVTAAPGLPAPISPWLGLIPLNGQVRVTDHLEIRSLSLIIDFASDPVRAQPQVEVTLDEAALFSAPLMVLYLAGKVLQGQSAYQAARTAILTTLQTELTTAVKAALTGLGVVTLAAPPGLPLAPTSASLRTRAQSLHLLYSVGGAPGDPNLITRSMLLASGAGQPVDAVALSISNACLLRDLVRPALVSRLALPSTGFLPDHPCFFVGDASLTVPGGTPPGTAGVVVTSLHAGIDEAGLLRVITGLKVLGPEGAFTYSATIVAAMSLAVTLVDRTLTVTLAPVGTPAVTYSDVDIALWVYAVGVLLGSPLLLSILATVDLLAGLLLAGPVGAAVGAAIPTLNVSAPLPGRLPPLALRATSTTQTDSARRTFTLAGPIMSLPVPDPFRSHDVILNFV